MFMVENCWPRTSEGGGGREGETGGGRGERERMNLGRQ